MVHAADLSIFPGPVAEEPRELDDEDGDEDEDDEDDEDEDGDGDEPDEVETPPPPPAAAAGAAAEVQPNPRATHWRIERITESGRQRIWWSAGPDVPDASEWPVAECSRREIRRRWGAGEYVVRWILRTPQGHVRIVGTSPSLIIPQHVPAPSTTFAAPAPAPAAPVSARAPAPAPAPPASASRRHHLYVHPNPRPESTTTPAEIMRDTFTLYDFVRAEAHREAQERVERIRLEHAHAIERDRMFFEHMTRVAMPSSAPPALTTDAVADIVARVTERALAPLIDRLDALETDEDEEDEDEEDEAAPGTTTATQEAKGERSQAELVVDGLSAASSLVENANTFLKGAADFLPKAKAAIDGAG